MRSTLNFDDELLRQAKVRAAATGVTLTQLIEDALHLYLNKTDPVSSPQPLRLVVKKGQRPPAADLADREALFAYLDQQPDE